MTSAPAHDAPGRRPSSLRMHVLSIVLIALVPVIGFAAAAVALFGRELKDTFRRGAMERTLALLTAVDTELKRSVAALEVLATSENFNDKNLKDFHARAERVWHDRTEWLTINLADPSGRQVMNLLRPFGTELHDAHEIATLHRVVETKQPAIGNLAPERLSERFAFAVRVPVMDEETVDYVLSALVKPEGIEALLDRQGVPPDWVAVVVDGNQTIVARTMSPEVTVGQPASESLRAANASAPEGWFAGSTIEGADVYTSYYRSPFSGWTVALGIPAAEVEAASRESIVYVALLGLGLTTLAIGFAWGLSGKASRSIERLARMAEDVGHGIVPRAVPSSARPFARIAEVDRVGDVLLDAARQLRARSDERDLVEAELRDAQAVLRESDRRKDQFLAMLGHELRNPLSVIATGVQVLGADGASASTRVEIVEMMQRQIAHMKRLLDDLLNVTRIAEGRLQVAKEPCDLAAIARTTAEDHRSTIEQAGLTLHLELPDDPLTVTGDATRLSQVLGNLLQNSAKFTDAGGDVTVSLRAEDGGSRARLTVRDTGLGMEPEMLARAFEPFSQAERTIERSRGGIGLGLALVKGLVALHGGEVSAASGGTGLGTTIEIRLPLVPAGSLAARPAEVQASSDRPRRVLIVDDNRMAARSLEIYLRGAGHTVMVAHTGPAGIETARQWRPEVVVCDIGLPGADGYQVAATLRQDPDLHDLRLIAVTGYGQHADKSRARTAGFDEHLTKPVDLAVLRRMLAESPH